MGEKRLNGITVTDDGDGKRIVSINLAKSRLVISVLAIALSIFGGIWKGMDAYADYHIKEVARPLVKEELARQDVLTRMAVRNEIAPELARLSETIQKLQAQIDVLTNAVDQQHEIAKMLMELQLSRGDKTQQKANGGP